MILKIVHPSKEISYYEGKHIAVGPELPDKPGQIRIWVDRGDNPMWLGIEDTELYIMNDAGKTIDRIGRIY